MPAKKRNTLFWKVPHQLAADPGIAALAPEENGYGLLLSLIFSLKTRWQAGVSSSANSSFANSSLMR